MAKRLKQQYLRLADNQELLQGVQGEIITADVLKPYIDALATKTNAQDIQTAVTALENKILGGVDMDGDTLSELYGKITTLKNLTDADKSGLVALISAKADEASVAFRLGAKADETSVATRLDAKADEASVVTRLGAKADEASVVTRLGAKADEASVATRLDAKADEASVATRLGAKADEASVATRLDAKADEASVATRLDAKITSAQAEVIAQGITNALETKIMGGVGTDADTFAELKGLLDNLQNLSEADVNGVMMAVSEKIAKSDIYNAVEYPQGFDSSTIGATLASFVTAVNLSSEKVVSSSLLSLLLKDLLAGVAQSWQAQGVMNDGFGQSIDAKLDKAEFQQVFANESQTGYQLKAKKSIEFVDISAKNILAETINFADTPFGDQDIPQFIEFCLSDGTGHFIVANEEANSRRFGIIEFVSVIANSINSPVAQRIKALEDRVLELEGMFENV